MEKLLAHAFSIDNEESTILHLQFEVKAEPTLHFYKVNRESVLKSKCSFVVRDTTKDEIVGGIWSVNLED